MARPPAGRVQPTDPTLRSGSVSGARVTGDAFSLTHPDPRCHTRPGLWATGRAWTVTVTATADRAGYNPLAYLTGYLEACAAAGGEPPEDVQLARFFPWAANPAELEASPSSRYSAGAVTRPHSGRGRPGDIPGF